MVQMRARRRGGAAPDAGGGGGGGERETYSAVTGYERRVASSLAIGGTALWAIDWTAVRGVR